jgi:hypothetical protein
MLVCDVSHPDRCIDSRIEFWCFFPLLVRGCVFHVFSFYLKVARTKKFASKPKFRGHKCVCVNEDTGISEKGHTLSDRSGESSCVKHNPTTSNKKIHDTSVNTELR